MIALYHGTNEPFDAPDRIVVGAELTSGRGFT